MQLVATRFFVDYTSLHSMLIWRFRERYCMTGCVRHTLDGFIVLQTNQNIIIILHVSLSSKGFSPPPPKDSHRINKISIFQKRSFSSIIHKERNRFGSADVILILSVVWYFRTSKTAPILRLSQVGEVREYGLKTVCVSYVPTFSSWKRSLFTAGIGGHIQHLNAGVGTRDLHRNYKHTTSPVSCV